MTRLLSVPQRQRDIHWLRSALQLAVGLELATLPPYLCAWWSVKDRNSEAARLIKRVIDDEMYHLGVVCNLTLAVGGRPRVRQAAPVYPGPLPGGVHKGVTIHLSGLTKALVHDVMMAIEAPESPLARSVGAAPSIGVFYEDLLQTFRSVSPELSGTGQLSVRIGSDLLRPAATPDDVDRSIEIIKEQGEGTDSSPDDTFENDHPAHYYAFGEIYHGRRLRVTRGTWQYDGAVVPFPAARPMARVPADGWPHAPARVRTLLDQFDTTYTAVLDGLDSAWSGGGGRALSAAVHSMRGLEDLAVQLMETGIAGGKSTYGPRFRAHS
ncbi:hypothetical protein WN71_017930 [Streptomyces mangrovisoli]|uniref:Iminophenyl-pyruvate dimer synthase domain-containing protein n=1 Tax=Streptomyces mangrovisoli TaxID=1428628 RepID=A0A1J4NVW2_9ACTN|nr:hypothetical protein WN71_017930 [Streptomyces mangrovisoli]